MNDSAASTPSPASASATSASAAAGCDAARDKTINVGESSSSVTLLIKSSNQQYDDMNIDSDLCWTVQRLKKQLSLVYPGKPDINDQKLIYSGKLLDDAQKLSEVIRSYKDVYQQHHIFHLVCATKNIIKPPVKATAAPIKDTTPTTTVRNDASNPRQTANELRQRNVAAAQPFPYQQLQQQSHQQPNNAAPHSWLQFWERAEMEQNQRAANQYIPNPIAAGAVTSGPQMAFQQHAMLYNAWMQQVYAQYMQEWMQRTTAPGMGAAPTSTDATALPPNLPYGRPFPHHMPMVMPMPGNFNNMRVPGDTAQPQPQPVVAAAAAAAAVQPNEPPQAAIGRQRQGGNFPNIQEEPEMRDWLDSFFSFTRLGIFVTVLYFNSSPLRCLVVVLIASIIYLYHIGVLRRRRERNNNNINRNNNAAGEAAAFAAVQQIQRMMDAVERDNNDPQDVPDAAQPGVPAADAEPAVQVPAAAEAQEAPEAAALASANVNAGGVEQAAVAAEAAVVEPPNANNSVISVVRTFVITFFTSLLPEAPAL
ncbi:homocysteine-responsive endoplasmic reticulum-resident ubiquitin-like domain member 2 protein [Scaptodrosophila lebanonensis]|uniref:Homocysteine-responsive endoplasmic reticulum-resident ubiquitin-like domain member 2 protein n=1 Tax=Drosophila lebanonensis TaxID=7225 RepID=A0A6J2U5A3_DROLE|nr:homocysteine-responsive endoplasmic reticulum-resident ubiquitin-like domain member 2 protein [Scaptodrosophila lebanonensis]